MTITLDGVALPDQLSWPDRLWPSVAYESRRTIGGQEHLFPMALTGGRTITLTASRDEAWWSADQVDWLWGLAKEAGAVYPLVIDQTYKVIIESIELDPIIPLMDQADIFVTGDFFAGSVKFREVAA